MRVNHIGLPVREEARSLAFYATYLGFDPATARRYPDGTVIVRNADGFDLRCTRATSRPAVRRSSTSDSRLPNRTRCVS